MEKDDEKLSEEINDYIDRLSNYTNSYNETISEWNSFAQKAANLENRVTAIKTNMPDDFHLCVNFHNREINVSLEVKPMEYSCIKYEEGNRNIGKIEFNSSGEVKGEAYSMDDEFFVTKESHNIMKFSTFIHTRMLIKAIAPSKEELELELLAGVTVRR